MNFDVFDKSEIEKYEEEVKAKWGNTKAYQDYKEKDLARNRDSVTSFAAANRTAYPFSHNQLHLLFTAIHNNGLFDGTGIRDEQKMYKEEIMRMVESINDGEVLCKIYTYTKYVPRVSGK